MHKKIDSLDKAVIVVAIIATLFVIMVSLQIRQANIQRYKQYTIQEVYKPGEQVNPFK